MEQEILFKNEIKSIYDRWASDYDCSLWLFNLIGFRYRKYRKEAINRLNLKPGDTVVDFAIPRHTDAVLSTAALTHVTKI